MTFPEPVLESDQFEDGGTELVVQGVKKSAKETKNRLARRVHRFTRRSPPD